MHKNITLFCSYFLKEHSLVECVQENDLLRYGIFLFVIYILLFHLRIIFSKTIKKYTKARLVNNLTKSCYKALSIFYNDSIGFNGCLLPSSFKAGRQESRQAAAVANQMININYIVMFYDDTVKNLFLFPFR